MTPSLPSKNPAPPPSSVGQVIRRRRRALGLSQEDLAALMECHTSAADIQAMESARIVMPSWIRLLHLAKALELPVEVFVGHDPVRHVTDPTHGDCPNRSSLQETSDEPLNP